MSRNNTYKNNLYVSIYIMASMAIFSPYTLYAVELPAFPGAEGYGAVALGGRNGKVIKVTNFKDDGPGSLQAACAEKGPRIIIFEKAGVIKGDVAIKSPYITIAGQTAPSPGVTLAGRLLARPEDDIRLHDIVIRFLRIRPPRALGHGGDAIQLPKSERIILDHLSLSWANDEMVDIIHSSEVTIQWSTLEESDPVGHDKGIPHNFAILSAYPGSGNISIHHNLFAHHRRRLPSLSPQVTGKPGDFRNNVIYNFKEGLNHDGHRPRQPINIIGNYYKRGPNAHIVLPFNFSPAGRYYLFGNYMEGLGGIPDPRNTWIDFPLWVKYNHKGTKLNKPVKVATVTTHNAIEAYKLVLNRAGTFPRDRVTKRTVSEVRQGTGSWGRHAPLNPDYTWFFRGVKSESPILDSDDDGIPDNWEENHGLNKNDKDDYNKLMPSGYSAIEEYINERAEYLISSNVRNNNKK
jgi:pectate lyase